MFTIEIDITRFTGDEYLKGTVDVFTLFLRRTVISPAIGSTLTDLSGNDRLFTKYLRFLRHVQNEAFFLPPLSRRPR